MKNSILALFVCLVPALHAAQTNDFFHSSAIVEGASVSVRTQFDNPTVETGEPGSESNIPGTLWWSWTPPTAGRVILTPPYFKQGNRSGPALIAAYTGSAVDQLQPLNWRRQSTLGSWVFHADPAVTYHFQLWPSVDGAPEESGFDLAHYSYGPATNDHFADAAPLDGVPRSVMGATREPGEPAHAEGGPNKSLWWKWTATATGAGASMQLGWGTLTNVTIAIYQGETVETLQLIAKGQNIATFTPVATETYYIAAEISETAVGDIEIVFGRGSRTPTTRPIPGNLVRNPSFELGTFDEWGGSYGGGINEGAPDGLNYSAVTVGYIYQEIETVVGHPYRIRFISANWHPPGGDAVFSIWFGGEKAGEVQRSAAPGTGWALSEFLVTATTNLSRLEFRGEASGAALDQVSVVSMVRPPTVFSQPSSLTLFAGSSSFFHAAISGTEPIQRQWFFNGEPIAGATSGTLPLNNVTLASAGTYHLAATNTYGSVQTVPVTLTVEVIDDLQIVLQPESERLFAGQYHVLQTAAVSSNPITYQWFHNGNLITDATNASLVFASFSTSQTGSYHVELSSAGESSLSLPATLALEETAAGGGFVEFSNLTGPGGINAPVFDTDGNTRLAGPNFVAQLYAGPSADLLRPVGIPRNSARATPQEFGSERRF